MGFFRKGSPEKITKIIDKFDEKNVASVICPLCHMVLAEKSGGLVRVGERLLIAKYVICTNCKNKVKV